jgi:hypothetical protein
MSMKEAGKMRARIEAEQQLAWRDSKGFGYCRGSVYVLLEEIDRLRAAAKTTEVANA